MQKVKQKYYESDKMSGVKHYVRTQNNVRSQTKSQDLDKVLGVAQNIKNWKKMSEVRQSVRSGTNCQESDKISGVR